MILSLNYLSGLENIGALGNIIHILQLHYCNNAVVYLMPHHGARGRDGLVLLEALLAPHGRPLQSHSARPHPGPAQHVVRHVLTLQQQDLSLRKK